MQTQKAIRLTVVLALAIVAVYGVHWCTASSSLIAWSPGLAIGLPFYNSTIEASDTLYFSQLQWNVENASKATLNNVRIDTGAPFASLGIDTDANMTFSMLGQSKVSYLVEDSGTQIFSGVTEPDSVKIDGVLSESWTFSSGTLTVTGAITSVEILFNQGLTADEALAVGVSISIAVALAIGVAFGMFRRRRDDD
jgi:hypothetical protein